MRRGRWSCQAEECNYWGGEGKEHPEENVKLESYRAGTRFGTGLLAEKYYYLTWEDCRTISSVPGAAWVEHQHGWPKGGLLILKDVTKGNLPSNYRPLTCLPVIWKLFTGMISEEIYGFIDGRNLLPEEQKGCRNEERGTKVDSRSPVYDKII